MIDVVWDMETGDPDDFLTLLLLCGHPEVRLKAVTITPGTPEQVGFVRWGLAQFGLDIPVGAYNIDHPKQCLSRWHERVYGAAPPSRDARPGWEVLRDCCDADTTLITGAPLKNLGALLRRDDCDDFVLGRWVAQGGFAGRGVVPPALQLTKFKNLDAVPTYNFGGAPRAAERALMDPRIRSRRLVSKNVCHRVYYDRDVHERVAPLREQSLAMALIWKGMEAYLRKRAGGKKFHDPLAACCAIDENIGTWKEVQMFRRGGKWGAERAPGSGTWIIIDYDRSLFLETLTQI
ncbi:MAG: nucleoside hydrolase [Myxococcota bacterium]